MYLIKSILAVIYIIIIKKSIFVGLVQKIPFIVTAWYIGTYTIINIKYYNIKYYNIYNITTKTDI